MVAAKTTMWLVKILYKQNKSPDFGTENKNLDIGILAVSDIACVRPYVAHFETEYSLNKRKKIRIKVIP